MRLNLSLLLAKDLVQFLTCLERVHIQAGPIIEEETRNMMNNILKIDTLPVGTRLAAEKTCAKMAEVCSTTRICNGTCALGTFEKVPITWSCTIPL
jgi:hypothetical protein